MGWKERPKAWMCVYKKEEKHSTMKGSKRSNPSLLYSFLPIIESGRHSGPPHLKCFFHRPLLRARFYCTFTSLSDFEFPFKAISPMTQCTKEGQLFSYKSPLKLRMRDFFSDGKGIQSSYLLCLLKVNDVPVGMLIEVVAFLLQFVKCLGKFLSNINQQVVVDASKQVVREQKIH